MRFESKKDILFTVVIFGINLFLIGITVAGLINGELQKHEYWTMILILGVVGLLFWLYFGTSYKLSAEEGLVYRCGPFRGKIAVGEITEIVSGKTLWIGLRPATSRNGLIIKYKKYNEVYISPITNERFIEALLELNKEIKVTE